MEIPRNIISQVKEGEEATKKHVLFLALSTLRIDKQGRIDSSRLFCGDEEIGSYHYQLETTILYMKNKGVRLDSVLLLSTTKTEETRDFEIDGIRRSESAETYFTQYIKDTLGDDTEVMAIREKSNKVETVKAVIGTLRDLNNTAGGISLSIDMHGGLRDTQILIQNIITLLQYEKIYPREIYSIEYNEAGEGRIIFAKNTYDINNYVAGMSEFLSYGRSKSLENYYRDTDNELMGLIKNISDSIQLCDISKFDEAIRNMKRYIDRYQEAGDYNDLFIQSIKASYGELMSDTGRNRVANKVRWCVDNDFVQQALTIIESQMPAELLRRNILTYKSDEQGHVPLYRTEEEGKGDRLAEQIGDMALEEAIGHKKPEWESVINYSIVPWIRENCNEKVGKRYNGRIDISGTNEERYLTLDMSDDCLSKDIVIWRVDDEKNAIKFGFITNAGFDDAGRTDLARLLLLHLALKDERNKSNHASDSENRATLDEVKTAIHAYVRLADKVFDTIGK